MASEHLITNRCSSVQIMRIQKAIPALPWKFLGQTSRPQLGSSVAMFNRTKFPDYFRLAGKDSLFYLVAVFFVCKNWREIMTFDKVIVLYKDDKGEMQEEVAVSYRKLYFLESGMQLNKHEIITENPQMRR